MRTWFVGVARAVFLFAIIAALAPPAPADTESDMVDYLNREFADQVWPDAGPLFGNQALSEIGNALFDAGLIYHRTDALVDTLSPPSFQLGGRGLKVRFPGSGHYRVVIPMTAELPTILLPDIHGTITADFSWEADVGSNADATLPEPGDIGCSTDTDIDWGVIDVVGFFVGGISPLVTLIGGELVEEVVDWLVVCELFLQKRVAEAVGFFRTLRWDPSAALEFATEAQQLTSPLPGRNQDALDPESAIDIVLVADGWTENELGLVASPPAGSFQAFAEAFAAKIRPTVTSAADDINRVEPFQSFRDVIRVWTFNRTVPVDPDLPQSSRVVWRGREDPGNPGETPKAAFSNLALFAHIGLLAEGHAQTCAAFQPAYGDHAPCLQDADVIVFVSKQPPETCESEDASGMTVSFDCFPRAQGFGNVVMLPYQDNATWTPVENRDLNVRVLVHELGHTRLGRLTDEYWETGKPYLGPEMNYPHVAILPHGGTAAPLIPGPLSPTVDSTAYFTVLRPSWNHWAQNPQAWDWSDPAGNHFGGYGNRLLVYRPCEDCKMRRSDWDRDPRTTKNVVFCPVCRESLTTHMLGRITKPAVLVEVDYNSPLRRPAERMWLLAGEEHHLPLPNRVAGTFGGGDSVEIRVIASTLPSSRHLNRPNPPGYTPSTTVDPWDVSWAHFVPRSAWPPPSYVNANATDTGMGYDIAYLDDPAVVEVGVGTQNGFTPRTPSPELELGLVFDQVLDPPPPEPPTDLSQEAFDASAWQVIPSGTVIPLTFDVNTGLRSSGTVRFSARVGQVPDWSFRTRLGIQTVNVASGVVQLAFESREEDPDTLVTSDETSPPPGTYRYRARTLLGTPYAINSSAWVDPTRPSNVDFDFEIGVPEFSDEPALPVVPFDLEAGTAICRLRSGPRAVQAQLSAWAYDVNGDEIQLRFQLRKPGSSTWTDLAVTDPLHPAPAYEHGLWVQGFAVTQPYMAPPLWRVRAEEVQDPTRFSAWQDGGVLPAPGDCLRPDDIRRLDEMFAKWQHLAEKFGEPIPLPPWNDGDPPLDRPFDGSLAVGLLRGGALDTAGRFTESLKLSDRLLERHADSVALEVLRGRALIATGRPQDAVDALDKTVARHPNSSGARLLLADALFRSGKAEAGRTQLSRAVSQGLDDVGRIHAADLWRRQREFGRALESLDQVPAASSRYTDALIARVAVLADAGRHKEARSFVEARAKEVSDTGMRQRLLGETYLILGLATEATRALAKAKRPETMDVALELVHGAALLRDGQVDAALAAADHATTRLPRHATPRLLQAQALLAAGDSNRALEALGEFAARFPKNPHLRNIATETAALLDRHDRASEAKEIRRLYGVPDENRPGGK